MRTATPFSSLINFAPLWLGVLGVSISVVAQTVAQPTAQTTPRPASPGAPARAPKPTPGDGDRVVKPGRPSARIPTPTPSPVSPDGKTLVVPDEQKILGRAYHVIDAEQSKVKWSSTAPVEEFSGTARSVIGFIVFTKPKPGSNDPPSLAGEFRLGVGNIDTGLELRNHHLMEPAWLDAAKFPEARFHLTGLTDAKGHDADWSGTITGIMTIHGVSRELTIKNTKLSLLPQSEETKKITPGDLMRLECSYELLLKDFGITNPVIGKKVGEKIKVSQTLFLSTVAPKKE